MKKTLCAVIAAVIVSGSSLTVSAAPETMPDGGLFDAGYYAQENQDVVAVVGTDRNALYQHYLALGKTEGRKAYSSDAAVTVQPIRSRTECLTAQLPVFPAEVTARNNVLVPVVLEPTDGQYLCHTNVVTRTEFGLDGSRRDYSNDPIYLAARDYIVEWLINNGDNENNRNIDIPIRFVCYSYDDVNYFINLVNNLEIDLHKSEICKDKTLYMGTNPASGNGQVVPFGFEEIIFCNVYYWETPKDLFNKNIKEEIPINPTTGLPAKVGDSWVLEDGTIYVVF
ncbi:MAG: hypothetical protein K2P64_01500 [Lachnospiraceae bacterium]|nr:hypothetical protein [Lachnospiraceae bacterium]